MEIRGKEYNNWNLFELEGPLDLHSVHDLKNLFIHLKRQNKNVLLDFGDVKKVDSTGITCLMFGNKILADAGLKLRIANLLPGVKIVFQITRGFEVFEIFDEVSYAAEAVDIEDKKVA